MTIRNTAPRHARLSAIAVCLAASASIAAPAAALAGSATPWIESNHATTRLVVDTADWQSRKNSLVAGIHIKLDEGWKTYWRYPGDAGLPPRFDWSGSVNLKEATVLWPAPVRFHDSAGTSFGYKKEVVFPVLIEPVTPGTPVELNLKLEYAVCADICIPAEAELKLMSGKDGFFARSYSALLARFLGRVPTTNSTGARAGPSVSRAEAELTGSAPHLTVDARFPGGAEGADLFVEGPEGFYLAPAEPVGKPGGGTVRFKVDLTKGDNPTDLKGQTVTLTLVSETGQTETSWRID